MMRDVNGREYFIKYGQKLYKDVEEEKVAKYGKRLFLTYRAGVWSMEKPNPVDESNTHIPIRDVERIRRKTLSKAKLKETRIANNLFLNNIKKSKKLI